MDILGQLLQGALGGGQQQAAAPAVDVGGLASQFGLSSDQANSAVGALLPAILGGIQKTEQSGGLGGLAELAGGISAPHQDVDGGNSILGQIFGSKDVSRQVASHASAQTGISDTVLKAMLPIVAGLVAQQVAKKMGGGVMGGLAGSVLGSILGGSMTGGAPAQAVAPASDGGMLGNLGGLASMLDRDGDGNPLDDILGMVNR
jgi:hypothetical protein